MSDQGPPPPTPHSRGAKKTIVRRDGDWDCMVSQLRNIKSGTEHEIYGDEMHLCRICVCAMKTLSLVSSHCILVASSLLHNSNLSLVLTRPAAISVMPIVAIVAPVVLRIRR